MEEIEFSVNKLNVYTEVAKTTSYIGAKASDDETAYVRLFTTDEDRLMLERFWNEACNSVTNLMKPFIVEVTAGNDSTGTDLIDYIIKVRPSSAFCLPIADSIDNTLFSFFVSYITGKWLGVSSMAEAATYLSDAASMLNDVGRRLYYKGKPKRKLPDITP